MNRALAGLGVAVVSAAPAFADDQTWDIRGFSSVEVSSGITATITAGQEFEVTGNAIRGSINRLRIRKIGDTLVIDRKPAWGLVDMLRDDRFEVVVSMPSVEEVEAKAGSSVDVDADGAGDISGSASSGATLKIVGTGGGHITLDASSGGTLSASGDCDHLSATASSGASLSARQLDCETAELSASSGASLRANVSETLDATASSGASISVSGDPEMRNVSTSSGASISG